MLHPQLFDEILSVLHSVEEDQKKLEKIHRFLMEEIYEQPFLSGFYDDDGNKINPHSVPVPGLCLLCKSYDDDDPEENLLCLMNRYDQRNSEDFRCGAFEKK